MVTGRAVFCRRECLKRVQGLWVRLVRRSKMVQSKIGQTFGIGARPA